MNIQLVVFTDLDATLLDHHTYSYEAARPALRRLEELDIPVVLNSSKTASEINHLRKKMNNSHPFVIENGAAIIIPSGYFDQPEEEIINFSTDYSVIVEYLNSLGESGYLFRNFDALDVESVSELTGLDNENSRMAKDRFGSEPLLWDDSADKLLSFKAEIESENLRLIKGGRFYHVTGLFDKGTAIKHMLALFQKKYKNKNILSIGLGDSPNDLGMLNVVDQPVVIKSERSSEMVLNNKKTLFSSQKGPEGWNEEILKILEIYGY